jgi:hypothetical protein
MLQPYSIRDKETVNGRPYHDGVSSSHIVAKDRRSS